MSPEENNWRQPLRLIPFLLFIIVASPANPAERGFEDGVFVSDAMPELRLRVDPRFEYIGASSFVLKEIADVERHHWVTTKNGKVTAMIILQFEGLRDGIDGGYKFEIPNPAEIAGSNYRYAPERVELGGLEFVHNTWAWDNGRSIRENPGSEPAHTARLLAEHEYEVSDELIMARFVTEVGPEMRDELIVFYIEPLAAHGKSLADFPDGGPPSDAYDGISTLIKQRSLRAITWLERD